MKSLLFALLGCFPLLLYSQASTHADFQLEISFDKEIPVAGVEPFYYLQSGNHFRTITYSVDTVKNSILLSGTNEYILTVSFPTLIFLVRKEQDGEAAGGYLTFFLVSNGHLASYTGKQSKDMEFSTRNAVIIASLEKHHHDHAHDFIKIEKLTTYSGERKLIEVSTEMVKIKRK